MPSCYSKSNCLNNRSTNYALSFIMHTNVKLIGIFTLAKTGLTVMNIMLNVFVSLYKTTIQRQLNCSSKPYLYECYDV